MKVFIYIVLCLLVVCSSGEAKDLFVGDTLNRRLNWNQTAEYMAIPFKKRVKEIFYSNPWQQPIQGIIVKDLGYTNGTAIITAGGVGFTFANFRLKSERGGSLNYKLEVYV